MTSHPASDPPPDTGPAGGTIRYWAAARDAAGVAEETHQEATLGAALEAARQRHADRPEFAQVLKRCSFLVDGQPAGARDPHQVELPAGGVLEVLPPFAGG